MTAVNSGSLISCSFGEVPIPLELLPTSCVNLDDVPGGNIMDYISFLNVVDFGECSSLANPIVLIEFLLTGETQGPCVPVTIMPWTPGSLKVQIGGMPAILNDSITMCTWAGEISIDFAFAFNVTIEC